MRYEAEIEGRRAIVEIEERDGLLKAAVDQTEYDIKVLRPEEGVYMFFLGDRVYEAKAWQSQAGIYNVKIGARLFKTRLIDRKHRRSIPEQFETGKQFLTAPMPGKVVRLLLTPGDAVEAGQGVVVVEAMKMQNEVKSAKAGRVIEVRVKEGATVTANQVLAVVE